MLSAHHVSNFLQQPGTPDFPRAWRQRLASRVRLPLRAGIHRKHTRKMRSEMNRGRAWPHFPRRWGRRTEQATRGPLARRGGRRADRGTGGGGAAATQPRGRPASPPRTPKRARGIAAGLTEDRRDAGWREDARTTSPNAAREALTLPCLRRAPGDPQKALSLPKRRGED